MTKDETHKKLLEAAEKGWLWLRIPLLYRCCVYDFVICKHGPLISRVPDYDYGFVDTVMYQEMRIRYQEMRIKIEELTEFKYRGVK